MKINNAKLIQQTYNEHHDKRKSVLHQPTAEPVTAWKVNINHTTHYYIIDDGIDTYFYEPINGDPFEIVKCMEE